MAIFIKPPKGTILQPTRGGVPHGSQVVADGGKRFDIDKFIPAPGFEQIYIQLANEAEQKQKQQEQEDKTLERQQFLRENAIAQARASGDISTESGSDVERIITSDIDASELQNSPEFNRLSEDEQAAVRAVFDAVANNDQELAGRVKAAFNAAQTVADPFFAQQTRLAVDALERGFVSIDREEELKEQQLRRSLEDLQTDIENRAEFLSLDEANQLRSIERDFEQALENTRQNLAATGFTSSSRRAEVEALLEDERGDIVESTTRKFSFERAQSQSQLDRAERDTASEIERLSELAREGRLNTFRDAESRVGTANLPALSGAPAPLGGITGSIEQNRFSDIIQGTRNLF